MSAIVYKKSLFEALLNLLWRQWTSMGVAASGNAAANAHVIDPESLLVFSSRFARYDARLFDLVLAWVQRNAYLLTPARLKRIVKKSTWKDTQALGYILSTLPETERTRWASFTTPQRQGSLTPLFIHADNEDGFLSAAEDEQAAAFGFSRNTYHAPHKLYEMIPRTAATQLLRLRLFMGCSARAETALILFSGEPLTKKELANLSGYAWATIIEAMQPLLQQGIIREVTVQGRKRYIGNRELLGHFFFPNEPLRFFNWRCIYDALGSCWDCYSNPAMVNVSERTRQSEWERLQHHLLEANLCEAGFQLGQVPRSPEELLTFIRQL